MSLGKIKYFIVVVMLISNIKLAKAIYIERVCLDKNNDITIIWSKPLPPCDAFIHYRIYGRENSSSAFLLLKEIADYNITQHVEVNAGATSNEWDYYIEYKYNCGGEKKETSKIVGVDKESPKIIQIDSLSVVNGFATIGWTKSGSTDTKGYIVYYVDGNDQNIQIGYLNSRDSTFFIDSLTGDSKSKTEQYRIVAIDSCDNFSSISFGHKSVFLDANQDSCKREISLSWSHYSAWGEAFRRYEVLLSKEGGTYKVVSSLPGNALNFVLTGLENETNYSIIIRARNINKSLTASSNARNLKTNFVESPSYVYLSNVNVVDDKIVIDWTTEASNDIMEFKIYKGEFSRAASLYKTIAYNSNTESYVDDNVDVNKTVYNYQVAVIDLCGTEVAKSNTAKNIVLLKDDNDDGSILSWNRYTGWNAGLEKQLLYVEVDEEWSVEAELGKVVSNFASGLRVQEMKGYEKCFYIEDHENDGNMYGFKETSKSNIVCLTGALLAFWPNTFTPSSGYLANEIFAPKGMLINLAESEMTIYSRWGEEIFYSKGIENGWDGTINGNIAPVGTYYYHAILMGKNGEHEKFTSTIQLLR